MGYDPEWEAKKAEGVALVKQGHSFQAAADATSVPPSTLYRSLQALESGKASAADLHALDQALMRRVYAVAAEATGQQLERLQAGGLEPRDLNGMAGISMRAVSNYRRWNAPSLDTGEPGSSSKLLDRLEAILASGNTLSLTVSPRPPDESAIDVEARELDPPEGSE